MNFLEPKVTKIGVYKAAGFTTDVQCTTQLKIDLVVIPDDILQW